MSQIQVMRRRAVASTAGVLAAVLALGACSSSGSTPSSGGAPSSGATPSSGSASTHNATFKQVITRPTSIGITESPGPVPTNKTIDYIEVTIPSGIAVGAALSSLAKTVGWKVRIVSAGDGTDLTKVKAAYDQAVSDKPDAVLGTGFPAVVYASELQQLKSAGIPVVEAYVSDPVGNGIVSVIDGVKQARTTGTSIGAYLAGILDSKRPDALVVNVSAFPTGVIVAQVAGAEYRTQCGGCGTVQDLEVPGSSLGGDLTSRIVGALRSNPKIGSVALTIDDMVTGLPQALKAAGLSYVHIVVNNVNAAGVAYLQQGAISGIAVVSYQVLMGRAIDSLIRYFNHKPVTPDLDSATLPWIMTKATIPSDVGSNTEDIPDVADFQQQFATLWGVK